MQSELQEIVDLFNNHKADTDRQFLAVRKTMNDLFFSLIGYKLRKKVIEEIVEIAVLQHFSITREDFIGKRFVKEGRATKIEELSIDKDVVEARKWFMSIMTYILSKTPYTMSLPYPFYHSTKVFKHKEVFYGAMDPVTKKDNENNVIFRKLVESIMNICQQEGVLDENFKDL